MSDNHWKFTTTTALLVALALVMAACTLAPAPPEGVPDGIPEARTNSAPAATETPSGAPSYDWFQLLDRDSIAPIYDPQFVTAWAASYPDNELVMGVEIAGDARAYPVSLLTMREMVNDEVGGVPILVTW